MLFSQVDSSHYPKWTELIGDLLSKGIRTLTYINPLFSNVTQRGTPFTHNYLEEGLKNDYFIKLEDGSVWSGYGNSCMADLSPPGPAYEWMINIIIKVPMKAPLLSVALSNHNTVHFCWTDLSYITLFPCLCRVPLHGCIL